MKATIPSQVGELVAFEADLITFDALVRSMRTELRDNPVEAGRKLYQTAVGIALVAASGISPGARLGFPVVTTFTEINLRAWLRDLVVWLHNLSIEDRTRFYSLQFLP